VNCFRIAMTLSNKIKKMFFMLFKISIVIIALHYIQKKLTTNEQLSFTAFINFLTKNDLFLLKSILFLSFLSILNWFIEILKWQNLVKSVKKITIIQALKQSLVALTFSIFTPNKIGDYAAKTIYFSASKKPQIIFLNFLNNMGQLFSTCLFGIVGLTLFFIKYNVNISHQSISRLLFITIFSILLIMFILKYGKSQIMSRKLKNIIDLNKHISKTIHINNIMFSVIRYLIFSFQFYVLLVLVNVNLSYFEAMIPIASIYLLSSVVPTIVLFDFAVKGSIALYIFKIVGINEITTISIITLMWILNVVIPTLIGSYFILNFNFAQLVNSSKNITV
jgi:hypothetical protein